MRRAHNRPREAVREAVGREPDPSGAVIDSQAVKGTGVGGPERGYDGAKRLSGRKRHLLVDTGGLVLGAHVHAANLHDRDGVRRFLSDELKSELPRMELLWADGAYTRGFREWAEEERGWRVEGPRHHPETGSCGATASRRSLAGFWCFRGGGWWRGPSRA